MTRFFVVLFVLISLFTLVSCGNSLEGVNLVVIVGNRANTHELTAREYNVIEDIINRSFESVGRFDARANVSFIVSDGEPRRREIGEITVSANNVTMRTQEIERVIRGTIMPFMRNDNFRAVNEEADLIEALRQATHIIRNTSNGRQNHILIVDSGITTTGFLDMRRTNIQDTPVETIVESLMEAGALPDMTGIYVTFINIGNAAYPQLLPRHRFFEETLTNLWAEIIAATGAKLVDTNGNPTDTLLFSVQGSRPNMYFETGGGFPFVSVIPFRGMFSDTVSDGIGDDNYNNGTNLDIPHLVLSPPPVIFGTAMLGFVPDRYELRNPDVAMDILRIYLEIDNSVLAYLEHNPESKLYIVGSEARLRPNLPNSREPELSTQRANTVRQILESEFGIPSYRIESFGAGTTVFSWRNANEFPDGSTIQVQEYAQQNRVVAIIPSSAVEFEEIRNFLEIQQ